MWVAKSGGDFTSLQAALASITDNSANNPYVIRIAPGVYTETSATYLKDYVDVVGSGEHVTTLTCACGASSWLEGATLAASNPGSGLHTTVRHLTVINTGGDALASAVAAIDADDNVRFEHVTATATATGVSDATAGVYNDGSPSSATLTHVTASASGGTTAAGVVHTGAPESPRYTDLVASGSDAAIALGLFLNSGSVIVSGSEISGDSFSVFSAGASARITDSVISGSTLGVDPAHCADNVTPTFDPVICM